MFNEGKDREALARILDQHDPEGGVWRDDIEGYPDLSWWYPQVDVILAAGFHRTPAPAPDVRALIDEARQEAGKWGPGPTSTGLLLHRLADALEAAAASAPQVTDEMVDAAYRAALENGADRLWKADIRAALKAALGVSE